LEAQAQYEELYHVSTWRGITESDPWRVKTLLILRILLGEACGSLTGSWILKRFGQTVSADVEQPELSSIASLCVLHVAPGISRISNADSRLVQRFK